METSELRKRWLKRRTEVAAELDAKRVELERLDWALSELPPDAEASARTTTQEAEADDQAGQSPADSATPTPRNAEDGPSPMLIRVLSRQPGVATDARTALGLLEAEGWTTKSENPLNLVRSSLATLARKGVLHREGQGKYLYPATSEREEPEASDEGRVNGAAFSAYSTDSTGTLTRLETN